MATNPLNTVVKRVSDLATLINKLQSRIDTIDPENSLRLILNDGVYNNTFVLSNSGMSLTITANGTYTAGNYSEAIVNGRYIKVDDTQNFYTLQDGDATYDRIDIVYIGRFGLGVVQGTPSATPTDPDLPADSMALYKITVPAGETDGTGLTITDVRVALKGLDDLEASITDKADKVSGATAGNLAGLDTAGNLTDSGKSPADFETAGAVATHESTYDHTQLHTHSNKAVLDAITDAGSGAIITDAERTALGNKADKVVPTANGNIATLDGTTGNLVDSGTLISDLAPASHTHLVADITDFDPTTKADKIVPATAGNLASLDSTGNLQDTGIASAVVDCISSDTTITFTNLATDSWNDTGQTDLAAAIQAKIDALPKRLENGATLTLQFSDGTYSLASTITISGFYGDGFVQVLGNSADAGLTTTKSVILDFTINEVDGIVLLDNHARVTVKFLHIKINATATNVRCLKSQFNSSYIDVRACIFENIGGTSYGYLLNHGYGGTCFTYQCYFTAGYIGALCQYAGKISIVNCDDLTTLPNYGVYANGGIIHNNIGASQINGATSDIVQAGAGVVYT